MLSSTSTNEPGHLPILLVLGAALFFGTIGARLFRRIRFPQVLGYIAIGILVGQTGFGLIGKDVLKNFEPFNAFALGIIGFLIGGELHLNVFKRYGRQLTIILITEGLAACAVVGTLTGAVTFLITQDARLSIALGLLLGAIGAATAPAATVRVLKECKTRGPLTTMVYSIVALDDGLALILFAVASSIAARVLTGGSDDGSLWMALARTAKEVFGAVILGAGAGLFLNWILRKGRDHERALTYIIGTLTLVVGLGRLLHVETILAAMMLGAVLANKAPRRSGSAFEIVERFAPPIFVLFFVLVGAHLHFDSNSMPFWVLGLIGVYIVALVVGKVSGSYLGARWAGAPRPVRKYLGLCMLCQAGVAVGLALRSAEMFGDGEGGMDVGTIVITVIAGAIFILEIVGPTCVKYAAHKSGEAGLDVTEEDLMASYAVADMVDRTAPTFPQGSPLALILKTIADTDAMSYPVTDDDGRLVGIISLNDLKQGFGTEGLTMWLVAFDLMQPVAETATEDMSLADSVERMREMNLDCLPVLSPTVEGEKGHLVGMLELRRVERTLSQEILSRRQQAEMSPA
jgi:Kef-type K+ transport system membrane component KefB